MAKDVNAPKVGDEAPDFTLKSHLDMAKDLQKKINTGENPGDMDNPGTPPSNPSLPPPSEPYTPPAGNPPSQPTQPGS